MSLLLDRTLAGVRIARWSGPVAPVSSPSNAVPGDLPGDGQGFTGTLSPARALSIPAIPQGDGAGDDAETDPGGGSTSMREAEPTWASDMSSLPSSGRRGDLPVDGDSGAAASVEGA